MDLSMEVIQGLIGSLGFPIFVAVYMMVKGSKDTQELRAAVTQLTTAIKIMSNQKED